MAGEGISIPWISKTFVALNGRTGGAGGFVVAVVHATTMLRPSPETKRSAQTPSAPREIVCVK